MNLAEPEHSGSDCASYRHYPGWQPPRHRSCALCVGTRGVGNPAGGRRGVEDAKGTRTAAGLTRPSALIEIRQAAVRDAWSWRRAWFAPPCRICRILRSIVLGTAPFESALLHLPARRVKVDPDCLCWVAFCG